MCNKVIQKMSSLKSYDLSDTKQFESIQAEADELFANINELYLNNKELYIQITDLLLKQDYPGNTIMVP